MENDDGIIKLAGAILRVAFDDYVKAIREDDIKEQKKLEKFFRSHYGSILSADHGEFLIEQAKKEASKNPDEVQRIYMKPEDM